MKAFSQTFCKRLHLFSGAFDFLLLVLLLPSLMLSSTLTVAYEARSSSFSVFKLQRSLSLRRKPLLVD